MIDALWNIPRPDLEARVADLEAENKRLTVLPEQLSEQLDHTSTCDAGWNLDSNGCTCGLESRIQLQTEQNIRSAWTKRALQAEAENKRLRKCADAMATAWEAQTIPAGFRPLEVAAYNRHFPREEAKHG